ncbi:MULTISPECIES: sensor histidine kinase [unclassified Streptomyces]|uniref:sensor histidine kinase n=1 Tax=unclassified Streptomyces TaxID=2593676 RepID=UPI000C26FD19|nr:sensor histidine kinase [Streptomyces sp. CB02959]PJN36306.1 two-component sensor histidine kinase [Streptomyces sp. CB02959]
MIDHPTGWLRASPWVADLAAALGCFALSAPVAVFTAYRHHSPIGWAIGGLALACAPLAARTRRPVPVVVATLAVNIAQILLISFPGGSPIPTVVAVHAVARRSDPRFAWRVTAYATAAIVAASLIREPGLENLWQHLAVIAGMCLAVASGDAARSRQRLLAAAIERAERAERTREEEARRRVIEERLRIARELHDVVAHHITLVNAQAGVAHHLMRSDPDHAYQALERIRDTSRTALDELRATVGLLRHGDDRATPREPAPGLADLDTLLESFRHSGLGITLERTGRQTGSPVPPIIDLAAYRIVQEALTNTRKHAGPVPVRVHLDHRTDALRITVEDNGTGTPEAGSNDSAGTGHGMIGMRERAKAAGGTLAAGPRPAGGFRIHTELPLPAARKDLTS